MRCRQKGKIKPKHKTFSLLPHMLVPYHQIDINTMHETLRYQKSGKTLEQTKDHISQMGDQDAPLLENKQIHDFGDIFNQAFDKLNSVPQLKQKLQQTAGFNSSDPVRSVLSFIDNYQCELSVVAGTNDSNIVKLANEFFYHYQSQAYFERYFLFGTPSQHR
jgi:hypothetical protein